MLAIFYICVVVYKSDKKTQTNNKAVHLWSLLFPGDADLQKQIFDSFKKS